MASNEVEILGGDTTVEKFKKIADARALNRRNFMAALGMTGAAAGVGLVAPRSAHAQTAAPIPGIAQSDILNFALNLEYLEATFYSYALLGQDLPPSVTTGSGSVESVPGTTDTKGKISGTPAKITFTGANSAQLTDMLNEVYYDELNHVIALQSLLGSIAISRPTLNLLGTGTPSSSTTYTNTLTQAQFLSMARLFEDLGLTAYAGAVTYLTGSNLTYAAQIQAVEGFHAGAIRLAIILQNAGGAAIPYSAADSHDVAPFDPGSASAAAAGPGASGGFFATAGSTNASGSVPAGLAFTRTVSQILSIVYSTFGSGVPAPAATASGGFFPSGVNGGLKVV